MASVQKTAHQSGCWRMPRLILWPGRRPVFQIFSILVLTILLGACESGQPSDTAPEPLDPDFNFLLSEQYQTDRSQPFRLPLAIYSRGHRFKPGELQISVQITDTTNNVSIPESVYHIDQNQVLHIPRWPEGVDGPLSIGITVSNRTRARYRQFELIPLDTGLATLEPFYRISRNLIEFDLQPHSSQLTLQAQLESSHGVSKSFVPELPVPENLNQFVSIEGSRLKVIRPQYGLYKLQINANLASLASFNADTGIATKTIEIYFENPEDPLLCDTSFGLDYCSDKGPETPFAWAQLENSYQLFAGDQPLKIALNPQGNNDLSFSLEVRDIEFVGSLTRASIDLQNDTLILDPNPTSGIYALKLTADNGRYKQTRRSMLFFGDRLDREKGYLQTCHSQRMQNSDLPPLCQPLVTSEPPNPQMPAARLKGAIPESLVNIPAEPLVHHIAIPVNDDDDGNASGHEDRDESPLVSERDLRPFVFPYEHVELTGITPRGEGRIGLWADPQKLTAISTSEQVNQVFIEGQSVSSLAGDIELSYTGWINGQAITDNRLYISVYGVEKIRLSSLERALYRGRDLKPDPNYTAGKRLFAGISELVIAEVQIKPALEDIPLYLRLIDVDDPSQLNNAADRETRFIDNRDSDNPHGRWLINNHSGNQPQKRDTDELGRAFAWLRMPLQPGDNLRMVAATDPQNLKGQRAISAPQQQAQAPVVDIVGNPIHGPENSSSARQWRASPLITTWRLLNLHSNSMLRPPDVIAAANIGLADKTSGTLTSVDLIAPEKPGQEPELVFRISGEHQTQRYQNGLVRITHSSNTGAETDSGAKTRNGSKTTQDFFVYANASDTAGAYLGVDYSAKAYNNQIPAAGDSYELWDDDWAGINNIATEAKPRFPRLPRQTLPHETDIRRLQPFFTPAYIELINHQREPNVPFDNMVSDAELIRDYHHNSHHFPPSETNTPRFWQVNLLSAFQAENSIRNIGGDPNNERFIPGSTTPRSHTSAIYLETLRDWAADNNITPAQTEAVILKTQAHEIGHALNAAHEDKGIMTEGEQFSPESLHHMRAIEKPGYLRID